MLLGVPSVVLRSVSRSRPECDDGIGLGEILGRAAGCSYVIPLDWAERQFRAMGRRDAHDLAVELVAAYQGSAVLTSALGQPELMTRQARRLHRWIDLLHS